MNVKQDQEVKQKGENNYLHKQHDRKVRNKPEYYRAHLGFILYGGPSVRKEIYKQLTISNLTKVYGHMNTSRGVL